MRAFVAVLFLLLASAVSAAELTDFSPAEIARIARHGPWPPAPVRDASNRVSGDPLAARLGASLFVDKRLSSDGTLSCASCHDPAKAWTDLRAVSLGRGALERNAPTLFDLAGRRWFGWDGASDSLWAASLRPILAPRELAGSIGATAALLRADPALSRCYAAAFARAPADVDDTTLAVDAAKALAAFQETLTSARTPFDDFRDALVRGDSTAASRLPLAAQRGARLFVGRGNCALCHLGPSFTNGEFHDVGVPFFTASGADMGRHGGIRQLRESPFNQLGAYNDDPAKASGTATRHVDPQHRNFGEFRVPALRNVARTAPYMHNGSLATLHDVVRHYSSFDPDRLHADGEAVLKPLGLNPAEIDDLVAFLESLTAPTAPVPPVACRD